MSHEIAAQDRATFEQMVGQLESAWNAMDGVAFGAPFAEDADFVNIRADHFRGRQAIAEGHTAIFQTIYAGSVNRYTIETARLLTPDVALLHVGAVLEVPHGPVAGRHTARFSLVLVSLANGWQIASFHNTPTMPQGGR
jgi:uncharacterized protein (TIGR02246 family)